MSINPTDVGAVANFDPNLGNNASDTITANSSDQVSSVDSLPQTEPSVSPLPVEANAVEVSQETTTPTVDGQKEAKGDDGSKFEDKDGDGIRDDIDADDATGKAGIDADRDGTPD